MKKNLFLFTAIAGVIYLTMASNMGGPAAGSGGNRTGAKASIANCSSGGCHGAGTGPVVTITVESGTTPVTTYVPGQVYTVKIHGAGTTNTKYGFSFASVQGTGASQTQAGTPSGFPTNVAIHTTSGLSIVEHTAALTGSTGVYDVQFTWTAPSTGVGVVTMYATINSVNGNSIMDAGDVSGNVSITLPQVPVSVPTISGNTGIIAYPNPVVNTLNLQTGDNGTYTVRAYDLNGRNVANEQVTVNGNAASISTANWAPGFYQVVLEKDGNMQVVRVVKN